MCFTHTVWMIDLTFVVVLAATLLSWQESASAIKGGYYPSWNSPKFSPSSIRFSYFTHIFYAFAQPDFSTHSLSIPRADAILITDLVAAARNQNHPIKILLSIAISPVNSSSFDAMIANPLSRADFISSSIVMARRFNLDGLDLDWEFPDTGEKMSHFADLFIDWRKAIVVESTIRRRPSLLLSAAVYYTSRFPIAKRRHTSYPIKAMAETIDWVNVMCYDFHGASWEPSRTGSHAALFDKMSNVSASYGLGSWVADGMPKEKVVMGIPLYGRTWTLKNASEHGIGAPAKGPGPGEWGGTMIYSDVVEFNAMRGTTPAIYDKSTVSTYSHRETAWIGYDDRRSVKAKIQFGRKMGIGGYFFWALGYDHNTSSLSTTAWQEWKK